MKAAEVLAIRREINRQRKAKRTEAQIAGSLAAAKLAPPTGEAWRKAGVGTSWSADGVTRFMECTRHVTAPPSPPAKPAKVKAAPTTAAPAAKAQRQGLRVSGVRGAMIYTSAPEPARLIRYPS